MTPGADYREYGVRPLGILGYDAGAVTPHASALVLPLDLPAAAANLRRLAATYPVYGAYVAEVYRAGLEAVHWSQTAAARSLGLSQWQTLRHVVVPQAVRRILPPLLNDFVALQKDTALVGLTGLLEILAVANFQKNEHFNLSPVTGAAVFFLVVTIPFTRLVDYLIKRDRERTQAG
jgi:ABC-type amino acid transport system permease subunit